MQVFLLKRPDILKSQLLSRDRGMSPFNLLVQHQLLDAVSEMITIKLSYVDIHPEPCVGAVPDACPGVLP